MVSNKLVPTSGISISLNATISLGDHYMSFIGYVIDSDFALRRVSPRGLCFSSFWAGAGAGAASS